MYRVGESLAKWTGDNYRQLLSNRSESAFYRSVKGFTPKKQENTAGSEYSGEHACNFTGTIRGLIDNVILQSTLRTEER